MRPTDPSVCCCLAHAAVVVLCAASLLLLLLLLLMLIILLLLLLLLLSTSEYADDSACVPLKSTTSYCRSLEKALIALPQGTYVTKMAVRGRVGIDHLVLSSSLMQRPIVIYSDPTAGGATLYCTTTSDVYAAANSSLFGAVEVCGVGRLTFKNVIIEGCTSAPFLRGQTSQVVLRNVTIVPPSRTAAFVSSTGVVISAAAGVSPVVSLQNSTLSFVGVVANNITIAPPTPGGCLIVL